MAFHPYPQLIQALFNEQRFGRPQRVTAASPWPWVDHFGFGSTASNSDAHFALGFPVAPFLRNLALLLTVTRRIIKQKARRQPFRVSPPGIGLRPLVSTRFQIYFTPLAGVLFTFPSRYLSTIGHLRVFSLGGWSPQIPAWFHVSSRTWDTARPPFNFAYAALTLYGGPFQTLLLSSGVPCRGPTTPAAPKPRRFRLFPFRSPLLRESRLISTPLVTEMFHFSRYRMTHL